MMWCRESGYTVPRKRTRLFGCRAASPPRSHRQTADGTAASLVGQNAEQKRGRQTATKHPYIDSFPLLLFLLLFSSHLLSTATPSSLLHIPDCTHQRGNYLKYVFTFSCSVLLLWARRSAGFIIKCPSDSLKARVPFSCQTSSWP